MRWRWPIPAAATLLAGALATRLHASPPPEAFWRSIGPNGGNVTALDVFPSVPEIVYVGVENGGVYVSADGGETVRPANAGLAELNVSALAVSPAGGSVALAATGRGIFRTTDRGASWTPAAGTGGIFASSIVFDSAQPDTVYAVAPTGWLGKSTDGGASWSALGAPLGDAQPLAIALDPFHASVLYLGTKQQGVLRSDDGGAAWSPRSEGMQNGAGSNPAVGAIAVDPTNSSRIIAATVRAGVFISQDSGASWQVFPDIRVSSADAVVFDADGTAYVGNATSVFRLRPGDPGWIPATASGVAGWANAVALGAGAPARVFVGRMPAFFPGGLAVIEGETARSIGAGLHAVTVNVVAWDEVRSRLIGGTNTGLLAYANGGLTESLVESGAGILSLARGPAPDRALFAGTSLGVYRSDDDGASWTSVSNGLPPNYRPVARLLPPSQAGGVFLAATYVGLFRSVDSAASWSPVAGIPASTVVYALAADPGSAVAVYAGTNHGLFRSRDGGASWSEAGPETGGVVFDVAVAGSFVFAAAPDGVFRSGDGGSSWERLGGGLPAAEAHALAYDASSSTVYAGTYDGVWRSDDAGTTWSRVGKESPSNPQILSLAILPDGRLAAGTLAGGAYLFEASEARGAVSPGARRRGGTRELPPRP